MEQELALRRGCVHLLGQRTKCDPALLEFIHCGQQMRQRSAQSVELPHHQAIVLPEKRQSFCETDAVPSAAAGMVLEQMALIHTGSQQRVALKVQHLPVAVGGDAHVADQHVRKPPFVGFRTVAHSDMVCRAHFGGQTRHFRNHPWAVGNHMFSDRSNSASQCMACATVGGFVGLSSGVVLTLSA